MLFSASTLVEKKPKDVQASIVESTEETSYLEAVLEFNEAMHEIDITEKINYYRALKEAELNESSDLVLRENIVSTIRDQIVKAIQAILDFIGKYVRILKESFDARIIRTYEKTLKDSVTKAMNDPNKAHAKKDYKFFRHPSLADIIDNNKSQATIQTIRNDISAICKGENREVTGEELETAYKALARVSNRSRNTYTGKVRDFEAFKEYVEKDVIYTETISEDFYKWNSTFQNRAISKPGMVSQAVSGLTHELELAKKEVANSTELTAESRGKANSLVSQIKAIVDAWTWFVKAIVSADKNMMRYYITTCTKTFGISMKESGTIHGEPFNGETLFDNDDIRDFNPTEWLDLELTTECYEFSSAILESRRRIALNEATIFAENSIDTFQKLVAMREAEEQKLGDKFMQIIRQIITAIDKFFSDMKDKMSLDVNFVKKNLDTINNKEFKPMKVESSGDIIAGLRRILAQFNKKPYDYNTMKDYLSDEKTFFKQYIKDSLGVIKGKRTLEWKDDMSVSEYCKAYYGASMPKDKYPPCNYTEADFKDKSNLSIIVDFLSNPNAKIAAIRKDVTNLESEVKKVAADSANPSAPNADNTVSQNTSTTTSTSQTSTTNNSGDTGAKQESMYYSELYQKWFTEAEIQTDGGTTQNSGTGDNGGDQKKGSGDSKNAFKVYLSAYRSMLLAKLTGAAFIRSELMQVVKAHVKSYNPKAASENNSEQPTAQQAPENK